MNKGLQFKSVVETRLFMKCDFQPTLLSSLAEQRFRTPASISRCSHPGKLQKTILAYTLISISIFSEGTEIRSHRQMSGVCYRGRSTMYLVQLISWLPRLTSKHHDQLTKMTTKSKRSYQDPQCTWYRIDQAEKAKGRLQECLNGHTRLCAVKPRFLERLQIN